MRIDLVRNLFLTLLLIAVPVSVLANADIEKRIAQIDSTSLEPTHLKPLVPEPEQRRANELVSQLISFYHYRRDFRFNDTFSTEAFKELFKEIDPDKVYFRQADIEQFKSYRTKLDDAVLASNLKPAFAIFNRFRTRWIERYQFAIDTIATPFDFTKKQRYKFNRDKATWSKNLSAQDELWRKRVKNDALNLALAGNSEEKITTLLTKRYRNAIRRMTQTESKDVFRYFMTAVTKTVEPHTTYFSPRTADNFNIEMSLSLQGIGAVLQTDDVYTKVVRLVTGGPAARSGKLKAGDFVVGVAQGNKTMQDVVGWRLDDVVDKIRGKAGTRVVLEVLPKGASADGETYKLPIIREKIKLEDQDAKSKIISIHDGNRIRHYGVIVLPTFYIDFAAYYRGDKNYKSTTRDVRQLIGKLKKKAVDGIIIDLRNNGGGSLKEATELTGLFIGKGPVVQERSARNRINILRDDNPGVAYSGPLMVLTNRLSASASEIFAAAIKDYGRGLIVGGRTFGKGTVQTIQNLDRFNNRRSSDGRLGQLKYTVARFYRINGESTQIRGLIPDVKLPTLVSEKDFGEKQLVNSLPWNEIRPAKYTHRSLGVNLKLLQTKSTARVDRSRAYQILEKEKVVYNHYRDEKSVSLNLKIRKQERKANKAQQLRLLNARRVLFGFKPVKNADDVTPAETKKMESFDPFLKEAGHVMSDFIDTHKGPLFVSTE